MYVFNSTQSVKETSHPHNCQGWVNILQESKQGQRLDDFEKKQNERFSIYHDEFCKLV